MNERILFWLEFYHTTMEWRAQNDWSVCEAIECWILFIQQRWSRACAHSDPVDSSFHSKYTYDNKYKSEGESEAEKNKKPVN